MRRIGANSSLIMPMVAPRMANLIIFVKNDESEAGNTVPTSVAPWHGRCSPLVCTGPRRSNARGQRRSCLHPGIAGAGSAVGGDMAELSQYSIVTYERKLGHWRAAFVRKALTENAVRGTVHSSVTPDDFASEAEAQFAAEKIIRKF